MKLNLNFQINRLALNSLPAGNDTLALRFANVIKGADGLTPLIGVNGNWWIGDRDTGVAADGGGGVPGKSAYQAAIEGGYIGTEEEFNRELTLVRDKVDREIGKGLSTNDFTDDLKGKLEALSSGGSVEPVSNEEREVGRLRWAGREYTIFEQTHELAGLPGSAGEAIEVVLSDQPQGDNLYLKVDCLSVCGSRGFVVSGYEVERVFVDGERNTVVRIKCKEGVEGVNTALLTLRYVKGLLSYDTFEVSVPIDGLVSAQEVVVSMPTLKYDKRFAVMWEIDDSLSAPYAAFFKYTHMKWVDYKETYREFLDKDTGGAKSPKGEGEFGTRLLCHTDGCGNDVPFKYSSAWVSYSNTSNTDGIHNDTSFAMKYISWRELEKFLDFGNFISNHGGGDQSDQRASIGNNQRRVREKTGKDMFVYVQPGGIDWGEFPERDFDWFVGRRTRTAPVLGNVDEFVFDATKRPFEALRIDNNLRDANVFGDYKKVIDEAFGHATKRYIWLANHNIAFDNVLSDGRSKWASAKDTLDYVHDRYGKGGDDSCWFPSPAEFVEYLVCRKLSVLSKSVAGGKLVVKCKLARVAGFDSRQMSLLLTKGSAWSGVVNVSTSDNVVKSSFGVTADGLLVNVDLNQDLLRIAEKYTALFEQEGTEDARYDARFMCSRLNADLAAPFLARINVGSTAPVLIGVTINSGASATYDRNVQVTLESTGRFTHYRVAEVPDLSGVAWIAGSDRAFFYLLSEGYVLKAVFVQLKNEYGESSVRACPIRLDERPAVSFTVAGQSNNGAWGGVVPASQIVAQGGSASLSATAKADHVIESWTGADRSSGVGSSSGTAWVDGVQGDRTVVCVFKSTGVVPSGGRKAIVFNSTGNSTTPTMPNGEIANRMFANLAAGAAAQNIKDTKGEPFCTRRITPGASFKTSEKDYPTLSGDLGRYPDEYIKVVGRDYSKSVYPEGTSWVFEGVPAGNYKVSILISLIGTSTFLADRDTLRYEVNGTALSIPETMNLVNNATEWLEFTGVSVGADGLLTVIISSTKAWVGVPLNAVEIEKV